QAPGHAGVLAAPSSGATYRLLDARYSAVDADSRLQQVTQREADHRVHGCLRSSAAEGVADRARSLGQHRLRTDREQPQQLGVVTGGEDRSQNGVGLAVLEDEAGSGAHPGHDTPGVSGDAFAYAGQKSLHLAADHSLAEFGLGADLLVQALPGNAGTPSDLRHAKPVPALLSDDGDGRVEDALQSEGSDLVVEGGRAHRHQSNDNQWLYVVNLDN